MELSPHFKKRVPIPSRINNMINNINYNKINDRNNDMINDSINDMINERMQYTKKVRMYKYVIDAHQKMMRKPIEMSTGI